MCTTIYIYIYVFTHVYMHVHFSTCMYSHTYMYPAIAAASTHPSYLRSAQAADVPSRSAAGASGNTLLYFGAQGTYTIYLVAVLINQIYVPEVELFK